jgi:hypothetical protein
MLRTTRKIKISTILRPEDIIDLTQDSPKIVLKLPRTDIEDLYLEPNIDSLKKRSRKKQRDHE